MPEMLPYSGPITQKNNGAAATVILPLEVQFGIAQVFSIGLYGEYGRYVDPVGTKKTSIAMLGLAPHFYLANSERSAWDGRTPRRFTGLRIDDVETLGRPKSSFAGSHFGLSTGVGFLFGGTVGLELQARYLAHNMPLREYEFNGGVLDTEFYDADLRARGIGIQLALHFRF